MKVLDDALGFVGWVFTVIAVACFSAVIAIELSKPEKATISPVETGKLKAISFTYVGIKDGEPVYILTRKDVE